MGDRFLEIKDTIYRELSNYIGKYIDQKLVFEIHDRLVTIMKSECSVINPRVSAEVDSDNRITYTIELDLLLWAETNIPR